MSLTATPDWPGTIRAARAQKRWTQRQLAEAVGTSQAHISRIEAGDVIPSIATVERIMAALDGAPQWVPSGRGRMEQANVGSTLQELSVSEMLGTEAPETDWIVDGVIARGAVTMIAGREGSGKSMLTQTLAAGVAAGKPAAGLKCQQGRVWIIDAENGEALIHQRMQTLGMGAAAANRLRVFESVGMDLQRDRWQLLDQLDNTKHAPDLLVLDSWKSLWNGSEHNPGAVSLMLNELIDMAREYGIGVLLLHHTTKAADTYRGSTAIGSTVQAVFTFSRPMKPKGWDEDVPSDLRVMICRKMRLGAEPSVAYFSTAGGKMNAADPPWGTVHDD